MLSIALAVSLVWLGFLVALFYYACAVPSSQLLGRTLVRGPAEGERIALTFDDGPAPPFTEQILDILRDHDVPATFFVCGKNVEQFPDVVCRLHLEKHTIGNHTYSHPFLYFKSRARMAEEIDRTQAAIERVTGVCPKIFRPPYGARWFGLFDVLADRGLEAVQWSDPSFDWKKKNQAADVARLTLRGLRAGSVILMHDGREPRSRDGIDASKTVEALPAIIEGARRVGLKFVSIEEFLSKKPDSGAARVVAPSKPAL
ncbi:MAG TPA: polysaccharide deacetylase family protein [Terriglobia bacterium]|nr:polysaccharide deacetylase family protein [Terriglobia bacterium]